MDLIEAIVLGITQGLSEFLPISSSGHLILVPWLMNWDSSSLSFDAALHLGTLVAVFAYFWRDILHMVLAIPVALRAPVETLLHDGTDGEDVPGSESMRRASGKLGLLIVLASIPGGIVGLLAEGAIEDYFHDNSEETRAVIAVAALLAVFAIILLVAERRGSRSRGLRAMTIRDAMAVGTAQALALFPGVSRSGITLSAGLFRGMKRADAARFSFLLGIPLITVAGLKGVVDIAQASPDSGELVNLAAGMLSAAISGLIAIWGLLRFLQRSSTRVFVAYRLIATALVILLLSSSFR